VHSTIIALASGAPPVGVAVIRASGPAVEALALALLGRLLEPRVASLVSVRNQAGDVLDRALALRFVAPASFTGEDVLELHCHGGHAVIEAVLQAMLAVGGVRLALAGEFTRRAFDHGKLDLSAAEGLADLIDAQSESQRRQALQQMDGALGKTIEEFRAQLLQAVALGEAQIDFPDEGIEVDLVEMLNGELAALEVSLQGLLEKAADGRRIRDGFAVAIVGPPNAGKSSLLNALAGSEVAIVSPTPGTTRDLVEVRLRLGGQMVVVVDSAGLRESTDPVEAEGIRRAKACAMSADLRLFVAEESACFDDVLSGSGSFLGVEAKKEDLFIHSKSDLREFGKGTAYPVEPVLSLSTVSGDGVSALVQKLEAAVARSSGGEASLLTRLRHVEAVEEALAGIRRARGGDLCDVELIVEELRLSSRALGRITGRIGVEEVLGAVFSQFCIGK
jgi:tRNA modification GTPase